MSKPKVSIGLPVYNGQRYVGEAIESVLKQTYGDFELIISDNASTDRTPQICKDFMQRDSRVFYHRLPKNIGAILNFAHVYKLCGAGEYFKWAAADDVCLPTFLERCVGVLDSTPAASLAYTQAKFIDNQSQYFADYPVKLASDVDSAAKRFDAIATADHKITHNFEIFGLMRRAISDLIPQQGGFAASDRVFVARMALYGKLVEVPEPLFLSRDHDEQSIHTLPQYLKKKKTWMSKIVGHGQLPPAEWFDPKYTGKLTFPEWRLFREYFTSMQYGGLTSGEKLGCVIATLKRQATHGNWARLLRDFLLAGDKLTAKVVQSMRDADKPHQPTSRPTKPRAAA